MKAFIIGILCFATTYLPSTLWAGGCRYNSCYVAPVVQKVVQQKIIYVPQAYYQVASELRDNAIAAKAVQAAQPLIQQQIQQGIQAGLQSALSGRICLDFNTATGATGGVNPGVPGGYPAPQPNPGPMPPNGPPVPPTGNPPVPPNGEGGMAAVQAIFSKHCVSCHNPSKAEKDLVLTDLSKVSLSKLLLSIRRADLGTMPPEPHPVVPDEDMKVLKDYEVFLLESQQQQQAPPAPPAPEPPADPPQARYLPGRGHRLSRWYAVPQAKEPASVVHAFPASLVKETK